MKPRIIIVNNNMKIGGVQKALLDLLQEISPCYDVTLYLFNRTGEYLSKVPPSVKVEECSSLYKYFGTSQSESKRSVGAYITRSFLAVLTKLFGRIFVTRIISMLSAKEKGEYDVAISFMHDGDNRLLYGGCNDFVIRKINAKKKITFLHCDYKNCGANFKSNNRIYDKFDKIAACSEGCRQSFVSVMPHIASKCHTVVNCHNYEEIISLSNTDTVTYDTNYINAVIVARLNPEKGVERALHALKYALTDDVKVKLHVVGGGILRDGLEALSSELGLEGNVVFYGEQANPYRYMKNADMLFIPSFHEAAPLVIDEAVCLGVPVFSTRTTSSKDMILDRNCGWVCENDQESIDKGFLDVVSDAASISVIKHNIINQKLCDNRVAVQMFKDLIG